MGRAEREAHAEVLLGASHDGHKLNATYRLSTVSIVMRYTLMLMLMLCLSLSRVPCKAQCVSDTCTRSSSTSSCVLLLSHT